VEHGLPVGGDRRIVVERMLTVVARRSPASKTVCERVPRSPNALDHRNTVRQCGAFKAPASAKASTSDSQARIGDHDLGVGFGHAAFGAAAMSGRRSITARGLTVGIGGGAGVIGFDRDGKLDAGLPIRRGDRVLELRARNSQTNRLGLHGLQSGRAWTTKL